MKKFEWKLKINYVKRRVIECRRATDFSILNLSEIEYKVLSIIEAQLKEMQLDGEKLDEEKQYNKYQQAYQYLIFNNPPLSNPMEAYEYGRIFEKQFGRRNMKFVSTSTNKSAYSLSLNIELVKFPVTMIVFINEIRSKSIIGTPIIMSF